MAGSPGAVPLLQRLSANYLALGQFELARGALQELGRHDAQSASSILRTVAQGGTPPHGWLPSPGVPSPALLAWLAQCEWALQTGGQAGEAPGGAPIEQELLRTIASALMRSEGGTALGDQATLQEQERLDAHGNETLWQSQQGAGGRKQESREAVVDNEQGLPVCVDKDAMAWLLQHEPHLGRALSEKEAAGTFSELLLQQWHEQLERGDAKDACASIAQINGEGNGDVNDTYRALLHRTLALMPPHNPSTTQSLLWNAALAGDTEGISNVLQAAQDAVVAKAAEDVASQHELTPPLADLRASLHAPEYASQDVNESVAECLAAMFHHARVTRTHVLETVMQEALAAVSERDVQKAADILLPFPELAPLIAVMGWDMHAGHVAGRQDVLQRLWHQRGRRADPEQHQASAMDALYAQLWYQLQLARTVAAATGAEADEFGTNLGLERLAEESPVRVLADPCLLLPQQAVLQGVVQQPTDHSEAATVARQHDVELLHVHYALQAAVQMLHHASAGDAHLEAAGAAFQDCAQHSAAVSHPQKKVWLVSTLAALLQLRSVTPLSLGLPASTTGPLSELFLDGTPAHDPPAVISLAARFLTLLQHTLPSLEAFAASDSGASPGGASRPSVEGTSLKQSGAHVWARKVERWHVQLQDWQQRLAVLQQLAEQQGRQLEWRDGIACLQESPAQLLDRCIRAGAFLLGRQVAARYSLALSETAPLELALWLDHVGEHLAAGPPSPGGAKAVLDFASLPHKLSPLTSLLVCLDVALTAARSPRTVLRLLTQAKGFAQQCRERRSAVSSSSEKEPRSARSSRSSRMFGFGRKSSGEGDLPVPSDDWGSPKVQAVFDVADGLVQQLQDMQTQEPSLALPVLLSHASSSSRLPSAAHAKVGPNLRAITALHAAIKDAHEGKRQFLSGKLHNLVKALAEVDDDCDAPASATSGKARSPPSPTPPPHSLLGAGLSIDSRVLPRSGSEAASMLSRSWGSLLEAEAEVPTSPLAKSALLDSGGKRASCLSAFVHYVASIGDIMDEIDTTHTYNFFHLLYTSPDDLLAQLAFERGSTDTASRAAELMGADLLRHLLSASVPLVRPPTSRDVMLTSAVPKRPLEVEVARLVARSSPQQAILAAAYACKAAREQGEQDEARQQGLWRLALDIAESFPTLHRWLLLQRSLPVGPPIPSEGSTTEPPTPPRRFKRLREPDTTAEEDGGPFGEAADLATEEESANTAFDQKGRIDAFPTKAVPERLEARLPPLVDWEDESGYVAQVQHLMARGALQEALDLADSKMLAGAPDKLLVAVIEAEEKDDVDTRDSRKGSGAVPGWQACLRLRDKEQAARLALRCLPRWELAAGVAVLAQCAAHLPAGSALLHEVQDRSAQLQRYSLVLQADPSLDTWQKVEALYLSDPEGLTLRLSSKGAVAAALEVATAVRLPGSLRQELQSRHVVHLLTGKVTEGAGPAAALRYLKGLESDDAVAIVVGALPELGHLKEKSLLVRHLLQRSSLPLSASDAARLRSLSEGLRALSSLPLTWQQRCGHLAEHPALVLESLLMAQQFDTAHKMLQSCPSLQDDALILRYAAKALAPPPLLPPIAKPSSPPAANGRHSQHLVTQRSSSLAIPRSGERPPVSSLRSSSTAGGARGVSRDSEGQSTPRRISWGAGTSTMWAAASNFTRTLLHTGGESSESPRSAPKRPAAEASPALPPSQSAAWEAMSGPAERGAGPLQGRVVGDAGLTGDAAKDESMRKRHVFEGAPSAALLKVLLSLCSDMPAAVRELLRVVENTAKSAFAAPPADPAALENALRLADALVEAVQHFATLLSEPRKTASDEALLTQLHRLLPPLQVAQALLRAGVPLAWPDLHHEEARVQLQDKLVQEERFDLAQTLCRKLGLPAESVEAAWGRALLQVGYFEQARGHLSAGLDALDTPARREDGVQGLVRAIEAAPPVNLEQTRDLYSEMARSVALSSEEAFSFDAYLNVLNAPPEARPPPSRRSSEEQPDSALTRWQEGGQEGPGDYLDERRKEEALRYLHKYHPAGVLPFLFRHRAFTDACHLYLAHLPPPPTSAPPSGGAAQKPSGSLVDPLVTKYGSLDEVCELCVTYGAMQILEQSIEEKQAAEGDAWAGQHAAVLAKMATFCETHRHFHHLYTVQVLQKDHVAAGLTCLQLFQNSALADEAVQHLEAARDHFDEGLSARQLEPPESARRAKDARRSASAKLTEEDIIKFSTRVALQAEVVRAFGDSEGPPWQHSLFGNPSDPETTKRRSEVAEQLAEKNFDLAFRVIYDFRLPAVDTYAGAAASMAKRRRSSAVADLLKNITGTIDDSERDQILMAAINVYASQHKEHPTTLIDQLSSDHRKVLACVASGRLKSAFQFASRANNRADVQLVAHQARETGQLNVMDLCHQWLAKEMQPGTVR